MKKSRVVVLLMVFAMLFAVLGLTSCNGNLPGGSGGGDDGGDEFPYTRAYLNEHLTDEYQLEISQTEGTDPAETMEISYKKDNFMYLSDGSDTVALYKVGDTWKSYDAEEDTWTDVDEATFSSVQTVINSSVMNLLGIHTTIFPGMQEFFVSAGTETIAGVICDKYTYGLLGYSLSFSVARATGVCMKLEYSDTAIPDDYLSFEVESFKVSEVTFPGTAPE